MTVSLRKTLPCRIEGEGGEGGQNQPVEFQFFLLGNPGIVIQPPEWNCKVTFPNKLCALVRGAKRKYDHGSAIFGRDAIPTHVLLHSACV